MTDATDESAGEGEGEGGRVGGERAARRPVERDDLFRVRWVGDPAISPDGSRVAYVVSGLDLEADRLRYDASWMPLDGGAPQRCGPDDAQDRHPRWSPDGRRLAVISTRGGTGRREVWVIDVETGAAHPAARAPGPVSTFDWAPDGRQFAVTVERRPETPPTPADLPFEVHSTRFMRDGIGPAAGPGRREVWVLGADDDEAVRLTEDGEESDWNPVWAPDGATIACLSDRGVDPDLSSMTGLWMMAPDGTGRRQLVEPVGPIRVARWSPDGTEIAFLGHRHGDEQGENLELWTVSIADGATGCWSAGLDRSVGHAVRGEDDRGFGTPDLAWTPEGGRILAIVADGGTSALRWFDRDGGSGTVVGGDRSVVQFAAAAGSGAVVFAALDATTPGDLFLAAADGTGERRLTASNDAWLAEVALAPTRRFRAAAADGTAIDGWLTGHEPAPGEPPRPLILQVHGGPHYPIGERFSTDAQALAAQGYLVLTANPRGSQGYGAAFATVTRGAWGGLDHDDLMTLVDTVVASGAADPARLAIMGESYGGYMTMWSVGRTDPIPGGDRRERHQQPDEHRELRIGSGLLALGARRRSVVDPGAGARAFADQRRRADPDAAAADPRRARRQLPDRPERGAVRGAAEGSGATSRSCGSPAKATS